MNNVTEFTPAQARVIAYEKTESLPAISALLSLADQVEALTAERDALNRLAGAHPAKGTSALAAPVVPAPVASTHSSVMQLSELMRGLELPPTCATAQPAMLYEIGRAIAAQAREAATPPQAAPVAQQAAPMIAGCSVCYGSGIDVAGRPCPFAPHSIGAITPAMFKPVTPDEREKLAAAMAEVFGWPAPVAQLSETPEGCDYFPSVKRCDDLSPSGPLAAAPTTPKDAS